MDKRCRSQKSMQYRNRSRQTQSSPLIRHFFVHRQKAVGKFGRKPQQPFFQSPRLSWIAMANPLNPVPNFSKHPHA